MSKALSADFAVAGAGVVGACIAFGLAKRGHSVVLLDGAKDDPRASGANVGLVWVQGKGLGLPDYQALTRAASDAWPDFARELEDDAEEQDDGIAYERNGGLCFTFGENGFRDRKDLLRRLREERGEDDDGDVEMIGRADIGRLMPEFELGGEVSGASFCWRDGCVDPLRLHALLLRAASRRGAAIRRGAKVRSAEGLSSPGWKLQTDAGEVTASHVIAAAGLGTKELAAQLGLDAPVRPQRGQVLASERMPRVMGLPANTLRQTADGTFLAGVTKEEVGNDEGTTLPGARKLAQNALDITPMLKSANVVRHWAGLRIMTPDGAPVYDFGGTASAAACHSGISLAPVHAEMFVDRVLGNSNGSVLDAFSPRRFSRTESRNDKQDTDRQ